MEIGIGHALYHIKNDNGNGGQVDHIESISLGKNIEYKRLVVLS